MSNTAESFCLPHILRVFSNINSIRSAYKAICVIVIPFLFVSIVGNVIMLFCLCKCHTLHRPFKALLRNLVLSDLGVGLLVQPLFLASTYTALTRNAKSFCVVLCSRLFGFYASLSHAYGFGISQLIRLSEMFCCAYASLFLQSPISWSSF